MKVLFLGFKSTQQILRPGPPPLPNFTQDALSEESLRDIDSERINYRPRDLTLLPPVTHAPLHTDLDYAHPRKLLFSLFSLCPYEFSYPIRPREGKSHILIP